MENRDFFTKLVKFILTVLLVWLTLRYLLGAFAPFLLAWLTATLTEPVILQMTEKFRIRRRFAAVLCSTVVLLSVVGIAALLVSRAFWELAGLAEKLPEKLAFLPSLLQSVQSYADELVASAPSQLRQYIAAAQDSIAQRAALLPGEISARLIGALSHVVAKLPSVALFTAAYAVSVYFISAAYPTIAKFIVCQLPDRWRQRAGEFVSAMRCGFGKWLRAQLTMSGIMFVLVLVAFLLLGVDSPLLLAFLTALVDALPLLGVGIVFVPWAVWTAVGGAGGKAAMIAAVWLLCLGLRAVLEPRLVGHHSGVNPAAALMAAYGGWRFVGVLGLIGFPLGLVILKEMNDTGVLRLWKTPSG